MGKDVGKVFPPSVHPHMIKPVPLQLYLQFPVLKFFPNLHIMYICWFYWGYEFVCWEKQTFLLK
jgi:hypothetical protein